MNDLKHKTAVITGGASGIGRAISEELAGLGAEVYIQYRSSEREAVALAESIASKGGKAHLYRADLTREEEVQGMFADVASRFDGLDVLINNAGDLVGRKLLEDLEYEFHRRIMAVNIDSMVLVCRAALGLMKNRGAASIVNLASLAGRKGGHAGSLSYATAKGAVLAFTRALANELAPFGIRVNAVAPGLILGSRFHEIHTSEESKKRTIAGIPLGRPGSCEDVARAVAFLASECDGFITGATLDINGGVYMA